MDPVTLTIAIALGAIVMYQISGTFSSKKSKEKSILDSGRSMIQVSVDSSIKSKKRQALADEIDDINDLLEDSTPEAIAEKLALGSKIYNY